MGYKAPSLRLRLIESQERYELVNNLALTCFTKAIFVFQQDNGTHHSEDDIYIMLLDSLATFKQN